MKKLCLVTVIFLLWQAAAFGQNGSGSVAQGIALFKTGEFEQAYQMLFNLSDSYPDGTGLQQFKPSSSQNAGFVFYNHHEISKRSQMPKLQLIGDNSF